VLLLVLLLLPLAFLLLVAAAAKQLVRDCFPCKCLGVSTAVAVAFTLALADAAAVLVTTAAPELPTKPAGRTASSSEVDQSMAAASAPLFLFSATA